MPEGNTGFHHIVWMDDSRISRKNNGRMLQKHKACGTAKTRWVTAVWSVAVDLLEIQNWKVAQRKTGRGDVFSQMEYKEI